MGDELYRDVWPQYAQTQQKDLFWYERLWRVLLSRLDRSQGRLLDWGSGPGFLLKLAEREGFDAYGEEESALARQHARDLGAASFQDASFLRPYGSIISTEVLEHVKAPRAELERLWTLLKPGGLLALSVPNDGKNGRGNPLQRLFGSLLAPRGQERGGLIQCGDRTKPWIHHTHLNYWSPDSLKELVESAGFEVVWQRTSFPVELLLVLPIPRKWAWKLSRLWPAPPLLWRWGIGRHCLLVARKPG